MAQYGHATDNGWYLTDADLEALGIDSGTIDPYIVDVDDAGYFLEGYADADGDKYPDILAGYPLDPGQLRPSQGHAEG